jgi:hypothetical protein
MNKTLGGLVFLAGILLLAGIVFLLLWQPVAPGIAPGAAPPSAPVRMTQLESELARTKAALARLQALNLPRRTAPAPLADVFPEPANPSTSPAILSGTPDSARTASASRPFETGYGTPIARREGARRATSPVTPPAVAPRPSTATAPVPQPAAAAMPRTVTAPAGAAAPMPQTAVAPMPSTAAVPVPRTTAPQTTAPETVARTGRLALTYVTADLRRAIVGERIVQVGDTLESGARIMAIGDSSVTLRDAEGKRVRLKISTQDTADATPGGQP